MLYTCPFSQQDDPQALWLVGGASTKFKHDFGAVAPYLSMACKVADGLSYNQVEESGGKHWPDLSTPKPCLGTSQQIWMTSLPLSLSLSCPPSLPTEHPQHHNNGAANVEDKGREEVDMESNEPHAPCSKSRFQMGRCSIVKSYATVAILTKHWAPCISDLGAVLSTGAGTRQQGGADTRPTTPCAHTHTPTNKRACA